RSSPLRCRGVRNVEARSLRADPGEQAVRKPPIAGAAVDQATGGCLRCQSLDDCQAFPIETSVRSENAGPMKDSEVGSPFSPIPFGSAIAGRPHRLPAAINGGPLL